MKRTFYLIKIKRSPYWQIIYYKNGKRTIKSTGTKLKSEALSYLTKFKEKLEETKTTRITLSDFELEYINHISLTHSKSYVEKSVALAFKMFSKYVDKSILLSNISLKVVEKFLNTTYNKSPQAARLYHRTLKSAFNKALLWGYIDDNVFKKIKLPRPVEKIPAYLNETDIKNICNLTKEDFLKNLFLFAFYTGARLSEIISMKWSDVNLDDRIIKITNTKTFMTKNKKDRIIPINNSLYKILSEMKKKAISNNEYIFYRIKGVKLNSDYVSKKFKKYIRLAGLSDQLHFHCLRHSFASLLHQRGVPLSIVKELLGHSDLKTTLIYSHLSKENLINAVELISSQENQFVFVKEVNNIKIKLIMN